MDTSLPPPLPTPAATVLMLRDGAAGLEVFMVRRHERLAVHAGAYVFPGGKVDAEDAVFNDGTHLDQMPEALRLALDEPELALPDAVSLYAAAIRETFEECGVLLAHRRGEASVQQVYDGTSRGLPFAQVLRDLGLTLSTDRILPWSRWITPAASFTSTRRFDTRFFVTAAPDGQAALHDDVESSGSVWITPRDALEQYLRGDIALVPPQIMSLAHLARHHDTNAVLTAVRGRAPYVVRPMPFEDGDLKAIAYPGDARHVERTAVMPGPSRLIVRNGRLEPEGGLQALLQD
jgi:8-oxo-dGTP pyrophosphatase MutT (NUDIX family)